MDRLLRLERVAELLDLSRDEARRMAEDGQLPTPVVLPGGQQRWRESDVSGWMMDLPTHIENDRVATLLPPDLATRDGIWQHDGNSVATEADAEPEDTKVQSCGRAMLKYLISKKCWVSGEELAAKVDPDLDSRSGTFARAVKSLKDVGLIESSKTHGYRACMFDTS